MSRFNKKTFVMVRLTTQQKARLGKGARKAATERGETVVPAALAREFILEGLDRVLGTGSTEPVAQAS